MKINWNEIEQNKILDCYSITISNGITTKERAYYKTDESNLYKNTGVNVIDYLVLYRYARFYSEAIGSDGNYKKIDLLVQSDFSDFIHNKLKEGFPFFDYNKVKETEQYFANKSITLLNYMIGSSIYKTGDINNICLYYRNQQDILVSQLYDYIDFLHLPQIKLPRLDKNSQLHIIAIDFSRKIIKNKLYFKFSPKYDIQQLLDIFKGTINYELVSDIINSNAFIGGFQVAFGAENISYNFYLKEAIQ